MRQPHKPERTGKSAWRKHIRQFRRSVFKYSGELVVAERREAPVPVDIPTIILQTAVQRILVKFSGCATFMFADLSWGPFSTKGGLHDF